MSQASSVVTAAILLPPRRSERGTVLVLTSTIVLGLMDMYMKAKGSFLPMELNTNWNENKRQLEVIVVDVIRRAWVLRLRALDTDGGTGVVVTMLLQVANVVPWKQ